jgi:Rps23 Pro-64 3,4-dihydroxylase Tpa1-like proline 4-hydroxylase
MRTLTALESAANNMKRIDRIYEGSVLLFESTKLFSNVNVVCVQFVKERLCIIG